MQCAAPKLSLRTNVLMLTVMSVLMGQAIAGMASIRVGYTSLQNTSL